MAAVTICKHFGAPQKSLSLFPLFSHLFAMKWQSCFLGIPYPIAFHPGALFPIKFLALSAHVSPQTIHFQVLDQSPVWALEGVALPATNGHSGGTLLHWNWHPDHSGYSGTSLPADAPDSVAATGIILSLVSSLLGQLGRVPHPAKEQEILLTSLPFPLSFLFLTFPILPLFSTPLVLDAGIWSKALSLG